MNQEVVKYIFLFLLGTSVLNFLIAAAVRFKTKHKEFNTLLIYWPAIILTFVAAGALGHTPSQIAFAYFFQFISSNLIVKMMCDAQGIVIKWRYYISLQVFSMLFCSYLITQTDVGFTAAVLPVAMSFALPFVRPIWHALVTNRRDASWIEKGMAYVFITGIVNHFNYALFRLDESTAWWGWSISIAQYQCLSLFLPLLINHRREANERHQLELALNKLTGKHEDKISKIEDLYQKLENEISQKEEYNRLLSESNARLEEEREVNEILIRTISHDLANPLTVISSYTELIHANKIPPNETELVWVRLKNNIKSSIDMISRIRKAILTRTQADLVKVSAVSLESALRRSIEVFESRLNEKNLKLDVQDLTESGTMVLAEENALAEHVFANILSNAIKYSYEGGAISVVITEDEHKVRINVRDWGIGIEDGRLGKRFLHSTPGTKGESGTGFGLMVLGYFVRKFDAHLEIQPAPQGKGTIVSLTLKKASNLENSLTSSSATISSTPEVLNQV